MTEVVKKIEGLCKDGKTCVYRLAEQHCSRGHTEIQIGVNTDEQGALFPCPQSAAMTV